jgi:DNA-binding PadR family transcriptional regulator
METPQRVTPVFIHVLTCLHERPGGVHGYAIITSGPHVGGAIYPVLNRLYTAGWVDREWDNQSTPRRRIYQLTAAGTRGADRLLTVKNPPMSLVG